MGLDGIYSASMEWILGRFLIWCTFCTMRSVYMMLLLKRVGEILKPGSQ